MKSASALPFIPRGLNRAFAAAYIGVGTTKFDEMVADGRMPKAKHIDGRRVWDRTELDEHFDNLDRSEESSSESNPFDGVIV